MTALTVVARKNGSLRADEDAGGAVAGLVGHSFVDLRERERLGD